MLGSYVYVIFNNSNLEMTENYPLKQAPQGYVPNCETEHTADNNMHQRFKGGRDHWRRGRRDEGRAAACRRGGRPREDSEDALNAGGDGQ